ncbi:uncharacterized protein JCM6883_007105 [Sporobolomyces salmoneus]|uniref:uncharacterized protein n=1 Tax=Sporobolomyces salmoneus TaxID=183962 RepID=UPI003179A8F2
MPIKLLQHKSWHVYSQENIARVKRDEALAAAQDDEQQQRTMLADSEARLDRMKELQKTKRKKRDREGDGEGEKELERQLKGKRREDGDREHETRRDTDKGKARERDREKDERIMSGGHLNFWAHLEANDGAGPSNATLEKRIEKVSSKSAKESEIDALTKVYLAKKGEGEPKGWYASEDGKTERERKEGEEATLERAYRDNETKRLVDPLALMNSYLKRREDVKSGNLDSLSARRQPSSRDRYLEPTSSSSRYSETPRSERGRREDDLEPVVTKLLGERRRRGDLLPPPPPPPPRSTSSQSVSSTSKDPQSEAAQRVSSERARTAALLAAKRKAALWSSASSVASTPRSEFGAQEGGYGMFNREEVRETRKERANAGWGERRERRGERERETRESWGRRR